MARYTGPKNRIARRFGINLFGRLRNPLLHKANPPGMHGSKKKKKSDFGVQLEEQQKLKAIYGMLTQRQFMNTYQKAKKMEGSTPLNFLRLLECRLDNIVYRLRLAPTIFAAQQLVSHGHVLVNDRKVDRRSFLIKPGMSVALKSKSQKIKIVQESQAQVSREIPAYLSLSEGKGSGKLEALPDPDQIPLPLPVDVAKVCEFLSYSS